MEQDIKLFDGTAKYYSKYRSGYDKKIYEEVLKRIEKDNAIVLDIGAGTGTIAHNLAPHVRTIYALDPSREMLEEARKIAEKRSIENIIFINDFAENIDQYKELENLDLVTFGASLHWIRDVDSILEKVGRILKSGGLLSIQSGALVRIWTEDPQDAWRFEVTNLIKKYLGEERRAGNGLFKEKVSKKDTFEAQLLARSDLFGFFCCIEVEHLSTWTPERVVGFLYSTSYARREYFGDKIDNFEDDVEALFKEKNMERWTEIEQHIALLAKRR